MEKRLSVVRTVISGADKINVAGYDMMLELSYRWEDAKNDSKDDSVYMSAEYRYSIIIKNANTDSHMTLC